MTYRPVIFASIATALIAGAADAQPAFQAYRILPDSTINVSAVRLNEFGEVLVTKREVHRQGPWIWRWQDGSVEELPGLSGLGIEAYGINSNREIVGQWDEPEFGRTAAFHWEDGVFRDLAPVNFEWDMEQWAARATDINEDGVIVGVARTLDNTVLPAWWRGDGPAETLVPLNGHPSGDAVAINDLGVVVGRSTGSAIGSRATVWTNGSPARLSDGPDNRVWTLANDINNEGWIVGRANPEGSANYQAVLWRDTSAVNLHNDWLGGLSDALAVNDDGWIVGRGSAGGVLWADDTVYALTSLVAGNTFADGSPITTIPAGIDINNAGEILAGNVLLRPIKPTNHFVVNSTGNDNDQTSSDGRCYTGSTLGNGQEECTLRAAIEQANSSVGPDTIEFNIAASGIPLIAVLEALPEIVQPLFIDGTSQPGSDYVRLSGEDTLVGGAEIHGLVVSAGMSKIQGLIIEQFSGNGIVLSEKDDNKIWRCIIGTDEEGEKDLGNSGNGIFIVNSDGNRIGDIDIAYENVIAFNGAAGIEVSGGTGNVFRKNSIYANRGLGIDLSPDGVVNPNDSADIDLGANDRQNYPEIDSVQVGAGVTQIYGRLNSRPFVDYLLEFFVSDECDSTKYGEGRTSVGGMTIVTNFAGLDTFLVSIAHELQSDEYLTATATDTGGNTSEFSRCFAQQYLILVDKNDEPIDTTEFIVSRLESQRPDFIEAQEEIVTTDSLGRILVRDLGVEIADSIRIRKLVHIEPAIKRSANPGSMYSITVDNEKFHDSTGAASFDEVKDTLNQRIEIGHTVIAYNVVVSIEWDALLSYIRSLEEVFRRGSNYFYDVADGQIRIDTVMIYDNGDHWDSADIQINTSNSVWPSVSDVDGIHRGPGFFGTPVNMPRKSYGDPDKARNKSYDEDPLDLKKGAQYSTILHEWGHYALSFKDEYKFIGFGGRCDVRDLHDSPYGYMDNDGAHFEPSASELSSEAVYTEDCRNTRQWFSNDKSCAKMFEDTFEKIYSGVLASIVRPGERELPAGRTYLYGPNEEARGGHLVQFDHDVGARVVFPLNPGPPVGRTMSLTVLGLITGNPKANSTVRTVHAGSRTIVQGNTSDAGKIRLLGVRTGDTVLSYGREILTGKRAAHSGEWYSGSMGLPEEESVELELRKVNGHFPAVVSLQLSDNGAVTFSLDPAVLFTAPPTVDHASNAGGESSLEILESEGGYDALVTEDLGSSGSFTVWAVDDSGESFFFIEEYKVSESPEGSGEAAKGSDGAAWFTFDPTNDVEKTAILSSPYPVPRGGLDPLSIQSSKAHALSLVPAGDLSGENTATIRYSESLFESSDGPYGNEFSLQIFRWIPESSEWESVGGVVDTAFHEVVASITKLGVYAVFTTETIPDRDAPQTTIGVLQNPILPAFLEIIVVVDEPLSESPTVVVAGDTIPMEPRGGDGTSVYAGSYVLTDDSEGEIAVIAVATDEALNRSETSYTFESFPVDEKRRTIKSSDGGFQLSVPDGAFRRDGFVLLTRDTGAGEDDESAIIYRLQPEGARLEKPAEVRLAAPHDEQSDPAAALRILRRDPDGSWTALPTAFDDETGTLVAITDRLGAFTIGAGSPGDGIPVLTALAPNVPNPFNAFTTISFTLADREHIKLDIYNVQGRRITRLVDGIFEAGPHEVSWNGTEERGGNLASGVYLYRLEAGSFVETKKMVLLK